MPEYIIDGITYKIQREFETEGASLLSQTIDFLLNLMEKQEEQEE